MVTSGRALASYETACQALAEARTVDEVKDIELHPVWTGHRR